MVRASELVNKGKNLKDKGSGKEEKRETEISLDGVNNEFPTFEDKKIEKNKKELRKPKSLNIDKNFFGKESAGADTFDDIEFKRHKVSYDEEKSLVETNENDKSAEIYRNALDVLKGSLNLFLEKNKIDIDGIKDVAEKFIRDIQDPNSSLIAKALFYQSASFNLIQHQVDVAILSLKVAMALGITGERLRQLLIGAMIHDIGFAKIPSEIIDKREELTENEREEIRKHPIYSRQFVLDALGSEYEWLATIVNREHERLDGSGYPKGLSGESIGLLPEIVGITDIYEALTHTRPQRGRMTPFDAVKMIINSYKKSFSKDVIKALVSEWSAFPVGSYVLLSSNKVGRVIEVNPLSPLKPKVEILYDAQGNKLEETEIVDLNKDTLVYIVAPVFYEDLIS
ncbi:MAG: HD domain-containing protein [Candidatus Schekmanbacteria bacterium]|nr:MAG: HD domain-containing protein [Candidatus Schekmanbacteria bacterium]